MVIGLSSPGHFYSPFVAHYLNFIKPLRSSLLWGANVLVTALGFPASFENQTIALQTGEAVRMVYSCIGYGVMSFWAAFVMANVGDLKTKAAWIAVGILILWSINVLRIVLILLSIKKGWAEPLGWDHHTWFTLSAYAVIFAMMYFYDRNSRKRERRENISIANQNIQALS